MSNNLDELTIGPGYIIQTNQIPINLITDLNNKLPELKIVRASSSDLQYAERDDIKNLPDIAVWWSNTVLNLPEAIEIEKQISKIIQSISKTLALYSNDIVTINPGTTYCNPHLDTPHRFKKYNFDNRLLGIQCIVALEDMTIENGVTGLVPYSQKRDFDIKDCYSGKYTRWFKENAKQFDLSRGSVLMYNCRVLHSSMSNKSNNTRTALAINYLDNSLVDEVRNIDNIWTSNGYNDRP